MFDFVVNYLGALKHIPLFAQFFDAFLKIVTALFNRRILDYVDAIEMEASSWPNVSVQLHKFGGIQFNFENKEIGHIHGNGILDLLLNQKTKSDLLIEGSIKGHHTFKNSGWITFPIRTPNDTAFAIHLLKSSLELRKRFLTSH
jgi:Family of unknown function (DUF5519)